MSNQNDPSKLEQLDCIADAFEAQWKAGARPDISQFIEGLQEQVRLDVLTELVRMDMDYRLRAGEQPDVDDYTEWFPELAQQGALLKSELARLVGKDRPAQQEVKKAESDGPPAVAKQPAAPRVVPRRHQKVMATGMAPAPASVVVPGYKLVREMQRGGQGVVYEGIQQSTGRRVAIKLMREGPLANANQRARFEREVQILAALDHPNIVSIIDRGATADGSHFLVMAFITGATLDGYLESLGHGRPEGAREPSDMLRLFLKIADAVNAAHLRDVVHRDLKPGNIMIDDRGEPHVLDFGLARGVITNRTDSGRPAAITVTGQFLGSLPWASPEQAEGDPEKIDQRTDVYALGVILYQMLTGQFPYEVVGNMRDVLNNILTAEPMPPSKVLEARQARHARSKYRWRKRPTPLNEEIEAIVLKALSKSREKRYQSAGELASDIGNYLSGRPTIAAGSAAVNRRRTRRLQGVAAAVGGVLLVAGIIALIWTQWTKRTPSEQPGRQTVAGVGAIPTRAKADELTLDLRGNVTMRFVQIPAGKFLMGSPDTEKDRNPDETQHEVTISKPFYMGMTEVTQKQYAAVMGDHPSLFHGDDLPVEQVSWDEAVVFCDKLTQKAGDGKHYRLPTEAEWEYACRAGTRTDFGFGDKADDLRDCAWYHENSGRETHPVGTRKANAWGLYDIQGNVWEWCADWYGPYPESSATDPSGPVNGTLRVLRGGAMDDGNIDHYRCAYRRQLGQGNRFINLGFRVVAEAPPSSKTSH